MYASIWVAKPECVMKVKAGFRRLRCESQVQHRPIAPFTEDLSKSINVGTRKMVNYAWTG
jgi:hypothetical protein